MPLYACHRVVLVSPLVARRAQIGLPLASRFDLGLRQPQAVRFWRPVAIDHIDDQGRQDRDRVPDDLDVQVVKRLLDPDQTATDVAGQVLLSVEDNPSVRGPPHLGMQELGQPSSVTGHERR